MFSRRAISIGAVLIAASACLAQAAYAATSATASVRANIRTAAGINIGNGLTLPAVSVAPVTTAVSTRVGSSVSRRAAVGATTGNAQLTIRGQPGDVVSTTVPESFTVVRNGGQETLTVKTNTSAEYQIGNGDVVLGGVMLNSATMSVDIGGSLALASAQNLVPGPYEGMLVVVVQYN